MNPRNPTLLGVWLVSCVIVPVTLVAAIVIGDWRIYALVCPVSTSAMWCAGRLLALVRQRQREGDWEGDLERDRREREP